MRFSPAAVALCAALAAPAANAQNLRAPFEETKLQLQADYWRPELAAEVRIGQIGTLLNLKDDLGVTDNNTFRYGLSLRLGERSRLQFSYTSLEYAGDVQLNRTIVFDGRTYSVNTRAVSSLDGHYIAGDLRFGIIRSEGFEFDGIAGVKYADFDALIESPDIGQRALASLKAPIPIVGAVARIHAGPVGFSGEFSGLSIGKRGSLYEFDIRARAYLGRALAAEAGYRRLRIRVDEKSNYGLFKPDGFYFGAALGL